MKTPLYSLFFFFLFQNFGLAQQPLVAISDQMNVIYMGIDNPVSIAVENFSTQDVSVSSEDVKVIDLGNGNYNFKPNHPGKVIINVEPKGMKSQEITYRVKRIPNPIARMGWKTGGSYIASELKKQKGVQAWLEGFDLGKCIVEGFEVTVVYKDKSKDPISNFQKAGEFSENTKALLETINAGDTVYFDMIKAKCPGDRAGRKINAMIFKIN